jgi:glycosyltransferase involved in cell wall biosynthesis
MDHITGYIVEAGHAEKFSAALLNLVDNEAIRKRFGQSGLHFVQDKFSYRRLVSEMSQYYYGLMEQKRVKNGYYMYSGK